MDDSTCLPVLSGLRADTYMRKEILSAECPIPLLTATPSTCHSLEVGVLVIQSDNFFRWEAAGSRGRHERWPIFRGRERQKSETSAFTSQSEISPKGALSFLWCSFRGQTHRLSLLGISLVLAKAEGEPCVRRHILTLGPTHAAPPKHRPNTTLPHSLPTYHIARHLPHSSPVIYSSPAVYSLPTV
jgi:hypothetical protein